MRRSAFTSLMDMPEPALALREAVGVLKIRRFPSVLHPAPLLRTAPTAACCARRTAPFGPSRWGRYFDSTHGAEDVWWFTALPKAERETVAPFRVPRTLSAWVAVVVGAGRSSQWRARPRSSPMRRWRRSS